MQFITGINRQQVIIQSLDNYIAKENPVRFIDAVVEKLGQLGILTTQNFIKLESFFYLL